MGWFVRLSSIYLIYYRDKAKETKNRFNIKRETTLLLFRKGVYYQYDEAIDNIDQLEKFALEGYEQAKTKSKIPGLPSIQNYLWS